MSEATCRTCPWWQGVSGAHPGLCRKNAPMVVTEKRVDYQGETWYSPMSIWPNTDELDWCGSHPSRKAAS